MKKIFLFHIAALAGLLSAEAVDNPGIPRDSNFGNTGWYDPTRIEARLVVPVGETTKTVHFVRDNNDPRVVTKTYVLKNVDAYEFRDYLRQMVQSKRVGNATLQQNYPGNTSPPPALRSSPRRLLSPDMHPPSSWAAIPPSNV